jgi:hypothetical protein
VFMMRAELALQIVTSSLHERSYRPAISLCKYSNQRYRVTITETLVAFLCSIRCIIVICCNFLNNSKLFVYKLK